jgi:hypothetical protein
MVMRAHARMRSTRQRHDAQTLPDESVAVFKGYRSDDDVIELASGTHIIVSPSAGQPQCSGKA